MSIQPRISIGLFVSPIQLKAPSVCLIIDGPSMQAGCMKAPNVASALPS